MGKGEMDARRRMMKADPDFKLRPEPYDFYVVDNLDGWMKIKKLVGSGQCPIFPQVASKAPMTRFWVKGPLVKGNAEVPAGTVIAAGWDEWGKYPNKAHGNHAAIYLGQNKKGLKVLDQWGGKDVSNKGFERTLEFGEKRGNAIVNGGDYFYVVLSDHWTEWDYAMAYLQAAQAATAGF